MMTTRFCRTALLVWAFTLFYLTTHCVYGQAAVNGTQQLAFAGLRSAGMQGQINGMAADSAGNFYLLLDQKDGVRVLKTDNAATTILAQVQLGASGDVGLALALDPAGQIVVTGTTTSSSLSGTAGSAFPQRTDTTTNSFVAGFTSTLAIRFVTFTGGSRASASAVSATADAVFVTGSIYSATLPVTPDGIQQAPAAGSSGNGFVERFSSDGSSLVYATYLTGASGDTTPAAIVADSTDAAYIAGSTSATGYPTVAALVPAILSNPSGFLTKLSSSGDAIIFSTFVPGSGLASLALDSGGTTLLCSGTVASGQFPVDTTASPLLPVTNQVLLKLPLDGSSVQSSILLAPGIQSHVVATAGSGAWVDGLMTLPLLPGAPLATLGQGFAMRVTASNTIDQTARFGGLTNSNASFSSLPLRVTSIAVDPAGEPVVGGAALPTASSSLLTTQTYDLPLFSVPSAVLPSSLRDTEQTAISCSGSLCAGSAAYLAKLNPSASGPSLAFSVDDAPFVTIRNLGSAQTMGLTLTSSAGTVGTNCGISLAAGADCEAIVPGNTASTLNILAGNAATQQIAIPASSAQASSLVFSPRELDFSVVSAAGSLPTRTVTVTNLGASPETFASALDASGSNTTPFKENSSDCTSSGAVTTKLLAGGATCHIQIGFTASSNTSANGVVSANWLIGKRDVLLTGYSQASALLLSATELDFGTEYVGGLRLPRYLYLYNGTSAGVTHATAALASGSPFTVIDSCPAVLMSGSSCRIRVDYLSSSVPSQDTATLTLDSGASVLLTGQMLAARTATGGTVNPNLSVTPASITFANAVVVTGASSSTQNVSITNTGAAAFSLSIALSGDFSDVSSCGATLAGGQTCAIAISFTPSQPGPRTGVLAVTAGANTTPAYVSLSGTADAIVTANDGTFDFGSIFIGQPRVQYYKISQSFTTLSVATTGPYSAALIEDIGYGYGHPSPSGFASSVKGTCANCYLAVQFLPTVAGAQPGTLTLTSAIGGAAYTLNLVGQGMATSGLLLTPLAQDFGSVPVNSASGSVVFTLTNLSNSGDMVSLTGASVSGDFALSTQSTGGQSCTGTLAYTASCLVAVSFNPSAAGARSGTLSISSSGSNTSAALTGFASADPGIAIRPLSLAFSNVPGTSPTTQTVTVTNTSTSTLQIGNPTTATTAFSVVNGCGSLASSATCSITVTYTAASSTSVDVLTLPVVSTIPGGNAQATTYSVSLTGNYTSADAGLQIVPGPVAFGPVAANSLGTSRQFTLNNLSGKALALNLTIPHNFVLTGSPCTSLQPGGSCSVEIEFAPLISSDITGSLYAQGLPSDGSAPVYGIGYLSGYGIGQGTLGISGVQSGNPLMFGQVQSGQNAARIITLTNRGGAGAGPITIRRITSAPPFLTTSTCGAALPAGQSCAITITYSPRNQVSSGTASPVSTTDTGLLTIESDATSSPDLINLSGYAGPVAVASPSNTTPIATFTLSQTSLTFATVAVGTATSAQTVMLVNTGTVTLHVLSTSTTADFNIASTCDTILPGAGCTLAISSTPQTAGVHSSALALATDSSTSLEFISLLSASTSPTLTVTPSALQFGSILVGASSTQTVQVTNAGTSAVTFTGFSLSGDYSVAGSCPTVGATLGAGAACTEQITFTPGTTGTRSGALTVTSSASTLPLTVALSGTGIQSLLLVSPATLQFGDITLGASASLSLTLTNSGTAPVTGLTLSVAGDYTVTVPCVASTLAPGASCTIQVTFTPVATGSRPGSLTVVSSDRSSPLGVLLGGNAMQAVSFALTVNGAAAASSTVHSGSPASYTLALTPLGGFTGNVAITCAGINAGPYVTCSLQPSTLTLGAATVNGTVTLNTITSTAELFRQKRNYFAWCLLFPVAFLGRWGRLKQLRSLRALGSLAVLGMFVLFTGCGSNGSGTNSNIHFTPTGTYLYQVTASSTNGIVLAQSVTVSITVQ